MWSSINATARCSATRRKNYALLGEDGHLTLKGAALKSRGMEPYLRNYLEQFVRNLLEGKAEAAASLRTGGGGAHPLTRDTRHGTRQDRGAARLARVLREKDRRIVAQQIRRIRTRPQERQSLSGGATRFPTTSPERKRRSSPTRRRASSPSGMRRNATRMSSITSASSTNSQRNSRNSARPARRSAIFFDYLRMRRFSANSPMATGGNASNGQ